MADKLYYVYILKCDNGSYYTGYTTDLTRRYKEHVEGTIKCKYTRSFKPVGVVQCWQINGVKADAMRLERFIKGLSKEVKERLISKPRSIIQLYKCKTSDVADQQWKITSYKA